MTSATLNVLAALSVSLLAGPAFASTTIPPPSGFQTYSGTVFATGSGACSAVTGTFPATISYTYNPPAGQTTYFLFQAGIATLTIQIQNPAQGLVPQNIVDVLYPDFTYAAFDVALFGTYAGVAGNYNVGTSFPFQVTNSAVPPGITYSTNAPIVSLNQLTLNSVIPGTGQACKIVLVGELYLI